jgi:hypothetical protein
MAPDIKLKALERELTALYREIHSAIVHDKSEATVVSPEHFNDNHLLVPEVVNELKKDGFVVTVEGRSNHAIYRIVW